MIITNILEDGRTHTYSDAGVMIQREDGIIYVDAVDSVAHTYTETDIPIPERDITPENAISEILEVLND